MIAVISQKKCHNKQFLQQKNKVFSQMIREEVEQTQELRNFIQRLLTATIDGSAITMCLLPYKNVSEYRAMLASQIAQASNIKDKANRTSVVQGLKSARQRLKQIKQTPSNGLILLAANVMFNQKHTYEKILQLIQPPVPVCREVYSCNKNFDFEYIQRQILVTDKVYGFIIIDGNSVLYATLKGNNKKILKQIKSDIKRNHNKGGQSALRFSRQAEQSRFNFLKAACEEANYLFSNLKEKIQGYIIAGSANFKHEMMKGGMLSPHIKKRVLKVIDAGQGSEEGLKMVINQAKFVIQNQKLAEEVEILEQFYAQVDLNKNKITNGYKPVMQMLQMGMTEVVICSDKLQTNDLKEIEILCDSQGCKLRLVSDKTSQGATFLESYGGIGAILRYEFDFNYLKEEMEEQTGINMEENYFI